MNFPLVRFTICTAVLTAGTARVAVAQRSDTHETRLAFSSGAGGNGYASGSVGVTHAFIICYGEIHVNLALNTGAVSATPPYYVDGRPTSVTGGAPQSPSAVSYQGTVYSGPSTIASISGNLTAAAGMGCLGETRPVGKVADLVGPNAKPEAITAYLQRLSLRMSTLGVPLRNPDIESRHRSAIAQARRDSISRVTAARQDSIARTQAAAARQDSITRAAATQQASASRPASGGGVGAAAGAAASAASAAGRAGTTSPASGSAATGAASAAAAQAQADADRQRQRDADAAERQRQADEARAADAARRAAMDQATTDMAVAAAGVLNSIGEAQRAARHRAFVRDAAAREDYRRRKTQPNVPKRLPCSRDNADAIALGTNRDEQLSAVSCGTTDNVPAHLYKITLARRQKLLFGAYAFFWPRISVLSASMGLVASNAPYPRAYPYGGFEYYAHPVVDTWLDAGTYYVLVSAQLPGESGQYSFHVRRGIQSTMGTGEAATIFAQNHYDIKGVATKGEGLFGFRLGLGILWFMAPVVEIFAGDGETSIQGGMRFLVGPGYLRHRPFVQYTYGSRSLSTDPKSYSGKAYTGSGGTLSLGAEYFADKHIGLEWGASFGSGSSSYLSSKTSFTYQNFRAGLVFHWGEPRGK